MRWVRHRLPWIIGVLLLTGSLLGANWMFNGPKGNNDRDPKDPNSDKNKNTNNPVVAIGQVDTANSAYVIYANTLGEVTDIYVKDGQVVTKGTQLLRIDTRLATEDVNLAESGVKIAQSKLEEAKKGVKAWEYKCEAQKKKIDAMLKQKQAAEERLIKAKESLNNKLITEADYRAFKADADALGEGIAAEQLNLKALEETQPKPLVEQAEANLQAANAQLLKAKIALDKCVLLAPCDGTVVRVQARVGDKFGPNLSFPAFNFRPKGEMIVRAEIDQEWATKVEVGQKAVIYDATNSGRVWRGKVTYLSDTFGPRRDTNAPPMAVPNPFQPQQENVLECRITLDPGQTPAPFIGQKVRVYLGGN
jgi:multidrug resistance efflux pump